MNFKRILVAINHSPLTSIVFVLGRHDRSKVAEFFMGSVSNDVVHQAHCSVLVIKDNQTLAEESQLGVAQPELSEQPLGLEVAA